MKNTNRPDAKYISAATTALRPSLPAFCRKRSLCQGQALRAACAGLDIRARVSGIKYMRATDGDASGGGSVNGYIISKCKNAKRQKRQKGKRHPVMAMRVAPKYHSPVPRIPSSFNQNTCQTADIMPHFP